MITLYHKKRYKNHKMDPTDKKMITKAGFGAENGTNVTPPSDKSEQKKVPKTTS